MTAAQLWDFQTVLVFCNQRSHDLLDGSVQSEALHVQQIRHFQDFEIMMSSSVRSDFAEIPNCVYCCFEFAAVGLPVYRTSQLDPVVLSEQLAPFVFLFLSFFFTRSSFLTLLLTQLLAQRRNNIDLPLRLRSVCAERKGATGRH